MRILLLIMLLLLLHRDLEQEQEHEQEQEARANCRCSWTPERYRGTSLNTRKEKRDGRWRFKGLNRLKLESVADQRHRHGRGDERRLYTDHFPVVVTVKVE